MHFWMFYAILSAQKIFHPKFFWVKQGMTQCYQAFLVFTTWSPCNTSSRHTAKPLIQTDMLQSQAVSFSDRDSAIPGQISTPSTMDLIICSSVSCFCLSCSKGSGTEQNWTNGPDRFSVLNCAQRIHSRPGIVVLFEPTGDSVQRYAKAPTSNIQGPVHTGCGAPCNTHMQIWNTLQ